MFLFHPTHRTRHPATEFGTEEAWCLLHGKEPKLEQCLKFLKEEPVPGSRWVVGAIGARVRPLALSPCSSMVPGHTTVPVPN